jgi:hypothetical protein
MKDWSDNELLERYRSLKADVSGAADEDISAITEELLRRGLSLPNVSAAPVPDSVDWSGEGGGEDPGSGALPNPV